MKNIFIIIPILQNPLQKRILENKKSVFLQINHKKGI